MLTVAVCCHIKLQHSSLVSRGDWVWVNMGWGMGSDWRGPCGKMITVFFSKHGWTFQILWQAPKLPTRKLDGRGRQALCPLEALQPGRPLLDLTCCQGAFASCLLVANVMLVTGRGGFSRHLISWEFPALQRLAWENGAPEQLLKQEEQLPEAELKHLGGVWVLMWAQILVLKLQRRTGSLSRWDPRCGPGPVSRCTSVKCPVMSRASPGRAPRAGRSMGKWEPRLPRTSRSSPSVTCPAYSTFPREPGNLSL